MGARRWTNCTSTAPGATSSSLGSSFLSVRSALPMPTSSRVLQRVTGLVDLPPELLSKVARFCSPSYGSTTHGDKHALAQLRLTCHLLNNVATALYFHTVLIPGNAARGTLGHAEAFARLYKMRSGAGVSKPREIVRQMLFMVSELLEHSLEDPLADYTSLQVPDGLYQLSSALLGRFTGLKKLHLVPYNSLGRSRKAR